MKNIILILVIVLCSNLGESKECEDGWFKYKGKKCVYLMTVQSTFIESQEFCQELFNSDILAINSEYEKNYWSFRFFRVQNLTGDIWLRKNGPVQKIEENATKLTPPKTDCITLNNTMSANKLSLINVKSEPCNALMYTACEYYLDDGKSHNMTKDVVKDDPNKGFISNERILPKNIDDSNLDNYKIFTGVYYKIKSKFNNDTLRFKLFGKRTCNIEEPSNECGSYYEYNDYHEKENDNYFIFDKTDDDYRFKIRQFSSNKEVVRHSEGLNDYSCYEDGMRTCTNNMKRLQNNPDWNLEYDNETDSYLLVANSSGEYLGVTTQNTNNHAKDGFCLYKNIKHKTEKLQFELVPLKFIFELSLYKVEFLDSFDTIISRNKKQISLIDTAIINNESPASLDHEVTNEKTLIETFQTTYGTSERFLQSFTKRSEVQNSNTATKGHTTSLADSASNAIAKGFSSTVSNSDSSSASSSSGNSVGANAGVSIPFIGANAGGSYSHNSESSSSNSHERRNENSNHQDNTHTDEHSHTKTDENSHQDGKTNTSGIDNQNQNETSIDKNQQNTKTNQRTYSIRKTVNVPPFTAVKISSYANWLDDIEINFKLYLKFTASSFRRKQDGKGTNEYRTLDAEIVKELARVHDFTGEFTNEKGSFDAAHGFVEGAMKASVGLESVFNSKEIKV